MTRTLPPSRQLYHRPLSEAGERAWFLAGNCKVIDDLRREVESALAAEEFAQHCASSTRVEAEQCPSGSAGDSALVPTHRKVLGEAVWEWSTEPRH